MERDEDERRLRTERELVDRLEVTLRAREPRASHLRMRVFREFEPGMGRVDLLCVWFDQRPVAHRLGETSGVPTGGISRLAAYAMAYIGHGRWVSLDELSVALRVTNRAALGVVQSLVDRRVVECSGCRVRGRPRTAVWTIRAIETYEAKLRDWKRAAFQAGNHLWFASQSFVAMPALGPRGRRGLSAACAALSIGSLFYDGDSRWTIDTAPPARQTPTTPVAWMLNESIVEESRHAAV